jgi:hypothetical protein
LKAPEYGFCSFPTQINERKIPDTKTCAAVGISRGSNEENKRVFDCLYKQKEQIEKDFGAPLVWERMDDKVTSYIACQLDGVSVYQEVDYPKMNAFLIDVVERMKKAFTSPISKLD